MGHRDYKEFAAGEIYHVYNRGNGRMEVFRDEQDYRNFLLRLKVLLSGDQEMPKVPFDRGEAKLRLRLSVFQSSDFSMLSYCLMPNHFHFCISQNSSASVSSLMLRLCTSYARYFNAKYDHVGHLFQDQFCAIRVDTDRQLTALSAYIHLNPETGKLVRTAKNWAHSSYEAYLGGETFVPCDTSVVLSNFSSPASYQEFVNDRKQQIQERKAIMDLILD